MKHWKLILQAPSLRFLARLFSRVDASGLNETEGSEESDIVQQSDPINSHHADVSNALRPWLVRDCQHLIMARPIKNRTPQHQRSIRQVLLARRSNGPGGN